MSAWPDGLWQRLLRGETRTRGERLAEASLRALAAVYGGALGLHLAGYRYGLARRTRLRALTISIGNLTVGGTGKTTACLAVARWLRSHGRRVALLSRGYRGCPERAVCVVSDGAGPRVEAFVAGDEPYLAAQAIPELLVLVGRDRRRTGAFAIAHLGADAVLLDDGFQYRRLVRDLDIALVDALFPFGYDYLVPRGLLREPVSQLARADAVWLTHCDLVPEQAVEAIRARVQRVAPGARLWETRHAPVGLRRLGERDRASLAALRDRRTCALSSLGNPLAFERLLEELGAEMTSAVRFPDHHRYATGDLQRVCQQTSAEWIVTTEKDAVRLPPEPAPRPVWVLEVALAPGPGQPSLTEEMECLLRARNLL